MHIWSKGSWPIHLLKIIWKFQYWLTQKIKYRYRLKFWHRPISNFDPFHPALCNHTFLIDLVQNGIPFGGKSIGIFHLYSLRIEILITAIKVWIFILFQILWNKYTIFICKLREFDIWIIVINTKITVCKGYNRADLF